MHIQKIKRQTGTAHRVHYSKNGIREQKYFPADVPYNDVRRWARTVDAASSRHIEPITSISINQFSDIYLGAREQAIIITPHRISLQHLIKFLGPEYPIAEITSSKLEKFRDDLLQKRIEGMTEDSAIQKKRRGVNKDCKNLRTIFTWGKRKGYFHTNPFDTFELLSTMEGEAPFIARDEERRFYLALPKTGHYRLAWKILKYSGMRRGELMHLQKKDVLFDRGVLRVTGGKTGKFRYPPLYWKLERILQHKLTDLKEDDYIIPHHKDYLTTGFRRALDRAGLQHVKSPVHVLRHAFGYRIMEDDLTDENERFVQEVLGHTDRQMTKRYTKIISSHLRKKMNKFKL